MSFSCFLTIEMTNHVNWWTNVDNWTICNEPDWLPGISLAMIVSQPIKSRLNRSKFYRDFPSIAWTLDTKMPNLKEAYNGCPQLASTQVSLFLANVTWQAGNTFSSPWLDTMISWVAITSDSRGVVGKALLSNPLAFCKAKPCKMAETQQLGCVKLKAHEMVKKL